MPYQKVDGTIVTFVGISTVTNYDYNLTYTSNGTAASGVSVQIVYTGITDINFKLQRSNDGIHFSDIPATNTNVTSDGNTVFDLGTPAYKILRTVLTPNVGTADISLIFNAVNLS